MDGEKFPNRDTLVAWVHDSRQRTLDLIRDLTDEQLLGPRLAVINPLLWEVGHIAWFQEKWVLRHVLRREPIRTDADAFYDSFAIAHDLRWDVPLPDRQQTLAYTVEVRDRVIDALDQRRLTPDLAYFTQYSVFHEDMHAEAFTYTRQTLGYPPPTFSIFPSEEGPSTATDNLGNAEAGDVELVGGRFLLGAADSGDFVFDNEKWAHPVTVEPFAISRTPVTETQFAAFVDAGGYRRREFWDDEGWKWRESARATEPAYWQRQPSGRWLRRVFDRWTPLDARRPMLHVNWYEARAWSRWANRRLPTEMEWELAASGSAEQAAGCQNAKWRYPWGNEPPEPKRANMDWHAGGVLGVHELPAGDSPCGCRQMIGNVWEWTASDFLPYPGFTPDHYREYSQPWFGTHKVLRGGCWATRSRLIRNTWRNFYTPERHDVWAGFRTCPRRD